MRNKFIVTCLAGFIMALVLSSCASLKPLESRYVKVTPQPLAVKGGKVPATITIDFPAKWFHKNAELKITPTLRYQGGEAWGTTTMLQGEKVRGNATSVMYDTGSKIQIYTEFVYKPEMQKSDLYLTFTARINGREKTLPPVKVGEGVIATENLASYRYAIPAIAPDKFQRIIQEKYDADILFLIQQAQLRAQELGKASIKEWKGIVKNADETPNQKVAVEVQAYASPDGGLELNEKLAEQREKNTTKYLKQQLSKEKVSAPVTAHYTAQDWEGFRELVEKSNLQDKDLVLRVLSMYPDPEVREREIKNISSVFKQLADEVLPQLRRSRLVANVEIIGKSDEELERLGKEAPNRLNVDELLYSAVLYPTDAEQQQIYQTATQLFPNDPRAYNNLGVLAYRSGDYVQAEKYFAQAAQRKVNGTPIQETLYNHGLMAMSKNDIVGAEQLFGLCADVPLLPDALGLLYLKQGRHNEAAQALQNTPTNNGVLAQILNKDYNKALELLGKIPAPDATTHYLKAIIGARTAQRNLIEQGVKQAVKMDPSMAINISRDREFARYNNETYFLQALKGM